eukprot:41425-Pleurochrysis_carterae.AAC.1
MRVCACVRVRACVCVVAGTFVATLDPTLSYRLSSPPFRLSASWVSLFFMCVQRGSEREREGASARAQGRG